MPSIKITLLAFAITLPTITATKASLVEGECKYNTYMCCFSQNDNGVQDNTDVCEPAPRDRRFRMLGSSDSSGTVSHESTFMLDQEGGSDMEEFEEVGGMSSDSETEFEKRYGGSNEGDIHCHGFVWADGAHFESFILPLYKYVRNFDHRTARGYYGRVKGGPQCECIEKMPVVSRADCTTYSPQGLVACEDNDLRTHYDTTMQRPGGKLTENLVETCPNA